MKWIYSPSGADYKEALSKAIRLHKRCKKMSDEDDGVTRVNIHQGTTERTENSDLFFIKAKVKDSGKSEITCININAFTVKSAVNLTDEFLPGQIFPTIEWRGGTYPFSIQMISKNLVTGEVIRDLDSLADKRYMNVNSECIYPNTVTIMTHDDPRIYELKKNLGFSNHDWWVDDRLRDIYNDELGLEVTDGIGRTLFIPFKAGAGETKYTEYGPPEKATPLIECPNLSITYSPTVNLEAILNLDTIVYVPGQSSVTLPGTISYWLDEECTESANSTIPSATDGNAVSPNVFTVYTKFEPTDTEHYVTSYGTVQITVNKANQSFYFGDYHSDDVFPSFALAYGDIRSFVIRDYPFVENDEVYEGGTLSIAIAESTQATFVTTVTDEDGVAAYLSTYPNTYTGTHAYAAVHGAWEVTIPRITAIGIGSFEIEISIPATDNFNALYRTINGTTTNRTCTIDWTTMVDIEYNPYDATDYFNQIVPVNLNSQDIYHTLDTVPTGLHGTFSIYLEQDSVEVTDPKTLIVGDAQATASYVVDTPYYTDPSDVTQTFWIFASTPQVVWLGTPVWIYGTAFSNVQDTAQGRYHGRFNNIDGSYAYEIEIGAVYDENLTIVTPGTFTAIWDSVNGLVSPPNTGCEVVELTPGPYRLRCTFEPTDNYNYTTATSTITATIYKKPITFTADNKAKPYGDPVPTLTYTVTGTVGDNTTIAGSPVLSTGASTSSPAGSTYTISISRGDLSSASYDIANSSFVEGTLTVGTQAEQTVTAKNPAIINAHVGEYWDCEVTTNAIGATKTYSIINGGSYCSIDQTGRFLSSKANYTNVLGPLRQTIQVDLSETTNYQSKTIYIEMEVHKGTPLLIYSGTLSEITYGTQLSATGYNDAVARHPITNDVLDGTFTYSRWSKDIGGSYTYREIVSGSTLVVSDPDYHHIAAQFSPTASDDWESVGSAGSPYKQLLVNRANRTVNLAGYPTQVTYSGYISSNFTDSINSGICTVTSSNNSVATVTNGDTLTVQESNDVGFSDIVVTAPSNPNYNNATASFRVYHCARPVITPFAMMELNASWTGNVVMGLWPTFSCGQTANTIELSGYEPTWSGPFGSGKKITFSVVDGNQVRVYWNGSIPCPTTQITWVYCRAQDSGGSWSEPWLLRVRIVGSSTDPNAINLGSTFFDSPTRRRPRAGFTWTGGTAPFSYSLTGTPGCNVNFDPNNRTFYLQSTQTEPNNGCFAEKSGTISTLVGDVASCWWTKGSLSSVRITDSGGRYLDVAYGTGNFKIRNFWYPYLSCRTQVFNIEPCADLTTACSSCSHFYSIDGGYRSALLTTTAANGKSYKIFFTVVDTNRGWHCNSQYSALQGSFNYVATIGDASINVPISGFAGYPVDWITTWKRYDDGGNHVFDSSA